MTSSAIVFVSWGRFVADCPDPACHNAREISRGDLVFACDPPPIGCGQQSPLTWPEGLVGEMASMASMPAAQQATAVPGAPVSDPIPPDPDGGHS